MKFLNLFCRCFTFMCFLSVAAWSIHNYLSGGLNFVQTLLNPVLPSLILAVFIWSLSSSKDES